MTTFSEILRNIMQDKKLNQLQLAQLLGIRQSQISHWLSGKSLPGYNSIKLLRDKVGVNPDKLFASK